MSRSKILRSALQRLKMVALSAVMTWLCLAVLVALVFALNNATRSVNPPDIPLPKWLVGAIGILPAAAIAALTRWLKEKDIPDEVCYGILAALLLPIVLPLLGHALWRTIGHLPVLVEEFNALERLYR